MAPKDSPQMALLDPDELDPWRAEWVGMPEFVQEYLEPWKSILVHFESPGDLARFAALIGQPLTPRTRSVWYPEAEIGHMTNKRYRADEP